MEEHKRQIGVDAKRVALGHLGRRLRQARARSRLTQKSVAQELGTTPQTVRNWEAGRHEPPLQVIRALAELYRMSEKWLLELPETALISAQAPLGFRSNRVIVEPEKLVDARNSAGLTQFDVAELTGLSLSSIRRYENGSANPPTTTLETLASIYNMPAEWFTPSGYFTDEEHLRFTESVTPNAARASHDDVVMQTYKQATPDLSEEAKLRIAKFIHFVHNAELDRLRFGNRFLRRL